MDPLALLTLIGRFAGLPTDSKLLSPAARSNECYSAARTRAERARADAPDASGRGRGRGGARGKAGGGGKRAALKRPSKPNSYSRFSPDAAEMLAEAPPYPCCGRGALLLL